MVGGIGHAPGVAHLSPEDIRTYIENQYARPMQGFGTGFFHAGDMMTSMVSYITSSIFRRHTGARSDALSAAQSAVAQFYWAYATPFLALHAHNTTNTPIPCAYIALGTSSDRADRERLNALALSILDHCGMKDFNIPSAFLVEEGAESRTILLAVPAPDIVAGRAVACNDYAIGQFLAFALKSGLADEAEMRERLKPVFSEEWIEIAREHKAYFPPIPQGIAQRLEKRSRFASERERA